MANTTPTSCLSPADGYRLWAETYDLEPNPMLSLERRVLEALLPPVTDLDIVDLGCGTGRWLQALKRVGARSLLGVDFSPEMLGLVKSKLGSAAKVICADCADVPLAAASADVLLCNFVLSYVEDARRFLEMASSVLRPGGSLFVTDVHPATAAALSWRRGVRSQGEFREIRTRVRTVNQVVSLCQKANLHVATLLEARFGDEERVVFERQGKKEYFDRISSFPAIYVLQLCAGKTSRGLFPQKRSSQTISRLQNARFALGPTTSFQGEMVVNGSRIDSLHGEAYVDACSRSLGTTVDVRGYLILPGLINAHDHLEFALFPRLGKGGYNNFLEWAEDIHRTEARLIAEQRRVPRETRLWWGGIRNLLSGVTTVCHHNPYESEVFTDEFAVRVLKDYGWAHSLSLDPAAAVKKRETHAGHPFLIHLAEGICEQSGHEILELYQAGALNADTVIIHGLGLGAEGSALLCSANAGLIWCPSSNLFLFGRTMSCKEIRRFPKVALGSDSPLTAQGDFLDEVRCASQLLQTPSIDLYGYVTRQAARLVNLRNGAGSFNIGGVADLIAVRETGLTPAETLVTLSYREVELVLLGGRVQLASTAFRNRLPRRSCEGLQPLSIEGIVRWIRAPLGRLFEQTTKHLHGDIYLGGKRVWLGA
jgi:cytosine/adenosine deaminase-related metal-dependent hydrolase/ubiquinone/menaquinone biosynthesis C-methylase UbiE